MQEELRFGEERMRMPFGGFDGVRTGKRIVVVAVLDIRLGEDAHPAELARLARTMSRGEHESRGDERAGAAECRLARNGHHDKDDGGMSIAVKRTIGDEGRTIGRRQIRDDSVAAEQADTDSRESGDKSTGSHDSSKSMSHELREYLQRLWLYKCCASRY